MKKMILFLLAMVCFSALATSALEGMERKPIPLSVSVLKSLEDPIGYKKLPVSVEIMIKDSMGTQQFSEHHESTLNDLAELKINVGQGTNQSPAYPDADLSKAKTICYTITVHDPAGDIVLMSESEIGQVPFSSNAEHAQNAHGLGGYRFNYNSFPLADVLVPDFDSPWGILAGRTVSTRAGTDSYMQYIDMNEYVNVSLLPSAVNDDPVAVACIGSGLKLPIVFSKDPIDELESCFNFYPYGAENVYNGLGVSMPQAGVPYGHSTAAIYADNYYDNQGVGLYSRGNAGGVFSTGLFGVTGISYPQAGRNGACIWGTPATGAGTGDITYAGLFQDRDFPNTTALGVFGGGFATKTFSTPSDRKLKTDIRSAALGLNVIMRLRPTQFRYIEGTPYSFPDGDQQGFIAQEVEEILPGLVTDLYFPKSLDPDEMATSGTETYKGINYTGLIPILTKAIQELNDKVDAQSVELARLRDELKACKPK